MEYEFKSEPKSSFSKEILDKLNFCTNPNDLERDLNHFFENKKIIGNQILLIQTDFARNNFSQFDDTLLLKINTLTRVCKKYSCVNGKDSNYPVQVVKTGKTVFIV